MNFEAIIGLEIHVEMKTKTKMFSSAPINFGSDPNTNVSVIDLAFPGTLPLVNKEAVRNAIRVSNALKMRIDPLIRFDRKNYFYSDLPKGYQITQQDYPLGSEGSLEINDDGINKIIGIERLHMEEDTAMQHHIGTSTLIDYNRAGIPLVEIVSKPEMHKGSEARKYVEKIREIVTYSGVSDGKMENGSLRCDVNISLRPYGREKFGTKVEVKNLNSIANIEKAIDFEIYRQSRLLLQGIEITQETRRYDETKKETVLMRVKKDAADYKYFREANIPQIRLSNEFIEEAIRTCPELYEEKVERFIKTYALNEQDIRILLSSVELGAYYEEIAKHSSNYQNIANFVISSLLGYLNKAGIEIKDLKTNPLYLAELVDLLVEKKINSTQMATIFEKIMRENRSALEIQKEMGAILISDEKEILKLIRAVLDTNPSLRSDYQAGTTRAAGFVMGQIMKKTGGKVDPSVANRLIVEELLK
ncbi:MAG TPA: Asp-tRNA(Asn)/Glu-tRNA(Gln) amidotransferase subunit GatB [Candidatus Onthovivens sp.]|nr:Asp-tRNA(Asn)/Glu-tRNA(Gln) amidotransferase subunit GatB [Candidatus Onthovivens sp.]